MDDGLNNAKHRDATSCSNCKWFRVQRDWPSNVCEKLGIIIDSHSVCNFHEGNKR